LSGSSRSDALDGKILVTICLLEGEKKINVRPVGEQLLDQANLAAVLLLELANLALILEGVSSVRLAICRTSSSPICDTRTSTV
jgi:hypothetical protein